MTVGIPKGEGKIDSGLNVAEALYYVDGLQSGQEPNTSMTDGTRNKFEGMKIPEVVDLLNSTGHLDNVRDALMRRKDSSPEDFDDPDSASNSMLEAIEQKLAEQKD